MQIRLVGLASDLGDFMPCVEVVSHGFTMHHDWSESGVAEVIKTAAKAMRRGMQIYLTVPTSSGGMPDTYRNVHAIGWLRTELMTMIAKRKADEKMGENHDI